MSSSSDRGRVLVVDDDELQRASLDAILADEHDVVAAGDIREAKRLLQKGDFDVLLTDYELPGGTGMTLLDGLAAWTPHTIAILVTGHLIPEVSAAQSDRRVFRVVLKPYDPKMLAGWVGTAVKLSRMRRSARRLKLPAP